MKDSKQPGINVQTLAQAPPQSQNLSTNQGQSLSNLQNKAQPRNNLPPNQQNQKQQFKKSNTQQQTQIQYAKRNQQLSPNASNADKSVKWDHDKWENMQQEGQKDKKFAHKPQKKEGPVQTNQPISNQGKRQDYDNSFMYNNNQPAPQQSKQYQSGHNTVYYGEEEDYQSRHPKPRIEERTDSSQHSSHSNMNEDHHRGKPYNNSNFYPPQQPGQNHGRGQRYQKPITPSQPQFNRPPPQKQSTQGQYYSEQVEGSNSEQNYQQYHNDRYHKSGLGSQQFSNQPQLPQKPSQRGGFYQNQQSHPDYREDTRNFNQQNYHYPQQQYSEQPQYDNRGRGKRSYNQGGYPADPYYEEDDQHYQQQYPTRGGLQRGGYNNQRPQTQQHNTTAQYSQREPVNQVEVLPGTVTLVDPHRRCEMDSDFKIQNFPPNVISDDETKPLLSFYVTMNSQPVRVKIMATDEPQEFARKLYQFCHSRQQPVLSEHRQKLMIDSLAFMIRVYKNQVLHQPSLQTTSAPFVTQLPQLPHHSTQIQAPVPEEKRQSASEELEEQQTVQVTQPQSNIIHQYNATNLNVFTNTSQPLVIVSTGQPQQHHQPPQSARGYNKQQQNASPTPSSQQQHKSGNRQQQFVTPFSSTGSPAFVPHQDKK